MEDTEGISDAALFPRGSRMRRRIEGRLYDSGQLSEESARRMVELGTEALARWQEVKSKYGPDRANGTVLRFDRAIRAETYSYAAIRANGRWYLTGADSPQDIDWAGFTETLARWGVTTVTELVADTDYDCSFGDPW